MHHWGSKRARSWVGLTIALAVPLLGEGCSDDDGSAMHEGGSTMTGANSTTTGGHGTDPGSSTGAMSTTAVDSTGSEASTGGDDRDDGVKFDVGGDDGGNDSPPAFPTTCEEAEAGQTSVGCIFYPARVPGAHQTSGFAVTNVSDEDATVTLSDIGGVIDMQVVPAGGSHVFPVDVHLMASTSGVGSNGMVLESDHPLQAFQFMPIASPPTADASIVLPGPTLGTKHRVVTYNVHNNNTWQYVSVVATEDDTQVTFTLEQPGSQALAGGVVPVLDKDLGPDSVTVEIDRLQHLTVMGHWENDTTMELNEFTGSLVESDKPVAVYSGKVLANIPEGQCCADLISTAVPPTTVWGTEYPGVTFLPVGQDKPDIWRLIGNVDGTVIELSGDLVDTIELDEGEFADVMTHEIFWMKANHPFGAAHFMTAGSLAPPAQPLQPYDCANTLSVPGDPAMGWIYPRGNWLHRYVLRTGSVDWCHDHATIVAPLSAWDDITLGGAPLPAVTPIGGESDHGYAWVPLPDETTALEAPSHVGVAVEVYGYVDHGSYYYPGGMGLQTINPAG
jgi:hypothetical protein